MKKRYLTSNQGLTLVELLVALSLVGIITILVMNFLLGGMDSYKSVNSDVDMHNEANYVMTTFVNHVYEATKVEELTKESNDTLIEITKHDGKKIVIGFEDNLAVVKMGGEMEQLSSYRFQCGDSEITIDDNTVTINLILEDEQIDGKKIELENKVSFVNTDKEVDGDE